MKIGKFKKRQRRNTRENMCGEYFATQHSRSRFGLIVHIDDMLDVWTFPVECAFWHPHAVKSCWYRALRGPIAGPLWTWMICSIISSSCLHTLQSAYSDSTMLWRCFRNWQWPVRMSVIKGRFCLVVDKYLFAVVFTR